MTRWRIFPVEPASLERAAALHAQCFPDEAWDREDFAGILAMAGASGRWIVDASAPAAEPQGFLFDVLLGHTGEIITLAVAPGARRRGAAKFLLANLFARARALGVATLTLEVADDNLGALALYEGLGFERVGLRPGYYRRPDGTQMDARLLRRTLLSN